MNCKNHQDEKALYQCDGCKSFFCEGCLSVRKYTDKFTAYICKECGGKCEPLVDKRSPKIQRKVIHVKKPKIQRVEDREAGVSKAARQRDFDGEKPKFFRRLPGIFIFPLKGKGVFLILLATALMFGISELSLAYEVIGELSWVIFATYLVVYLFKVAEDSARGSYRLQSFPNLTYWTGAVKPLVYVSIAVLAYLGPAQIYFIFINNNFDLIYVILSGLGMFLLPMSFVEIILSRKISSLNPAKALIAIFQNFIQYIFLCTILLGLVFLLFFMTFDILVDYGQMGMVASYGSLVYILFLAVRLSGIFAHYHYQTTEKAIE